MPGIFDALIQQESGGQAGVVGPKTKYGRALGLTQMLPATAEEMARKIGVPFNPALLTDASPQGAQYQRKLGEAYFNEGLERTGNERDALRYYHGGPNRAQWGPKTNHYADSVLARAGGTPMIKPRKPQAKAATQVPTVPIPMQDEPIGVLNAPFELPAPGASITEAPAELQKGKGGIFGSGLTGWDVLGSVADGYLLANGTQGAYTQGRRQEREMQFDRDKFNQELEARRQAALAKAAEPPQWLADAQTFARLPQEQRNMVTGYRDAMYPVLADYVDDKGNTRQGVYSRSQGGFAGQRPSGPPPEAVTDLKSAVASGDSSAIAEFEEVFGPGSARSILGN